MYERFLNFSQKYLRTDVRYLIGGGFWLTFSQFFSSLASLGISIVFANLLSKDTYGIYKYVLSIIAILSVTSLTGIDTALSQAMARNYDGSFISGLKRKIIWGFIGSAIGFIISIYYFVQTNNLLSISILIASILMPFMNGFDIYNSILSGKKQFKRYSFYNAWSQLITALFIILAIFISKNAIVIVSVYFLSNTLVNLYFLRQTLRNNLLNNSVDPQTIRYGNHLSLMDVVSNIAGQLDKVLVFHYFGAIELAIYSIAVAPTDQIRALLKNINTMAMPKFAVRTKDEIKKDINSKIFYLGLFSVIIVSAYIMIAPFAFKILFPKYLESVVFSQFIAVSIIASILSTFLYTALKAQASTISLYKYNILTNLVNVISLLVGIVFFGIWGAVWSRIIGRFFMFGLSYYLIKKM